MPVTFPPIGPTWRMRRTLSYQGGSDEQWNENVGRDRGGNVSVGNSHSVRLGRRRASLQGWQPCNGNGSARHVESWRHDVACPSQPPTKSVGPRPDGGPSHQAEGPRS